MLRSTMPHEPDELAARSSTANSLIRTPPCTRRLRRVALLPRTRVRWRRRTPPRASRRRSAASRPRPARGRAARPRSSRPIRSASASASAMSCVQSRIVASCSARTSPDELLHLELRARVEPRRRLVEQQQDGRGQQRPREGDLLLHAARQVLHRLRRAGRPGSRPSRGSRGSPCASAAASCP